MVGVASLAVHAQSLTDTQIAEAIKAGEARKFDRLVSDCVATAGFGSGIAANMAGGVNRMGAFTVVMSMNAGRIASMAARGKRLYQPVTLASVTDDLREPQVFVSVEPNEPSHSAGSVSVASPIETVVLKSKANPAAIIQPTKIDFEPVEWSNLLGGKVEANRAVALFAPAAVRELPAGEFDIVVVTTAGERRCKVGVDDRKRLFP
jgi:hypothetical protein